MRVKRSGHTTEDLLELGNVVFESQSAIRFRLGRSELQELLECVVELLVHLRFELTGEEG